MGCGNTKQIRPEDQKELAKTTKLNDESNKKEIGIQTSYTNLYEKTEERPPTPKQVRTEGVSIHNIKPISNTGGRKATIRHDSTKILKKKSSFFHQNVFDQNRSIDEDVFSFENNGGKQGQLDKLDQPQVNNIVRIHSNNSQEFDSPFGQQRNIDCDGRIEIHNLNSNNNSIQNSVGRDYLNSPSLANQTAIFFKNSGDNDNYSSREYNHSSSPQILSANTIIPEQQTMKYQIERQQNRTPTLSRPSNSLNPTFSNDFILVGSQIDQNIITSNLGNGIHLTHSQYAKKLSEIDEEKEMGIFTNHIRRNQLKKSSIKVDNDSNNSQSDKNYNQGNTNSRGSANITTADQTSPQNAHSVNVISANTVINHNSPHKQNGNGVIKGQNGINMNSKIGIMNENLKENINGNGKETNYGYTKEITNLNAKANVNGNTKESMIQNKMEAINSRQKEITPRKKDGLNGNNENNQNSNNQFNSQNQLSNSNSDEQNDEKSKQFDQNNNGQRNGSFRIKKNSSQKSTSVHVGMNQNLEKGISPQNSQIKKEHLVLTQNGRLNNNGTMNPKNSDIYFNLEQKSNLQSEQTNNQKQSMMLNNLKHNINLIEFVKSQQIKNDPSKRRNSQNINNPFKIANSTNNKLQQNPKTEFNGTLTNLQYQSVETPSISGNIKQTRKVSRAIPKGINQNGTKFLSPKTNLIELVQQISHKHQRGSSTSSQSLFQTQIYTYNQYDHLEIDGLSPISSNVNHKFIEYEYDYEDEEVAQQMEQDKSHNNISSLTNIQNINNSYSGNQSPSTAFLPLVIQGYDIQDNSRFDMDFYEIEVQGEGGDVQNRGIPQKFSQSYSMNSQMQSQQNLVLPSNIMGSNSNNNFQNQRTNVSSKQFPSSSTIQNQILGSMNSLNANSPSQTGNQLQTNLNGQRKSNKFTPTHLQLIQQESNNNTQFRKVQSEFDSSPISQYSFPKRKSSDQDSISPKNEAKTFKNYPNQQTSSSSLNKQIFKVDSAIAYQDENNNSNPQNYKNIFTKNMSSSPHSYQSNNAVINSSPSSKQQQILDNYFVNDNKIHSQGQQQNQMSSKTNDSIQSNENFPQKGLKDIPAQSMFSKQESVDSTQKQQIYGNTNLINQFKNGVGRQNSIISNNSNAPAELNRKSSVQSTLSHVSQNNANQNNQSNLNHTNSKDQSNLIHTPFIPNSPSRNTNLIELAKNGFSLNQSKDNASTEMIQKMSSNKRINSNSNNPNLLNSLFNISEDPHEQNSIIQSKVNFPPSSPGYSLNIDQGLTHQNLKPNQNLLKSLQKNTQSSKDIDLQLKNESNKSIPHTSIQNMPIAANQNTNSSNIINQYSLNSNNNQFQNKQNPINQNYMNQNTVNINSSNSNMPQLNDKQNSQQKLNLLEIISKNSENNSNNAPTSRIPLLQPKLSINHQISEPSKSIPNRIQIISESPPPFIDQTEKDKQQNLVSKENTDLIVNIKSNEEEKINKNQSDKNSTPTPEKSEEAIKNNRVSDIQRTKKREDSHKKIQQISQSSTLRQKSLYSQTPLHVSEQNPSSKNTNSLSVTSITLGSGANPSSSQKTNDKSQKSQKLSKANTINFSKTYSMLQEQHSVLETSKLDKSINADGQKQINNYIILKNIGQGAFGKVKQVFNTTTREPFAVKIINRDKLKKRKLDKSRSAFSLIEKEVAILKKMAHPNIVKLYEYIDDQDEAKIYMVMDLLKKGSINSKSYWKMEKGKEYKETDKYVIPEEKLKKYFRDFLLGLDYLHNFANVIHRDIKPDNLLIGDEDSLKIADFGVSQMFEGEKDEQKNDNGTKVYLAPEIFQLSEAGVAGRPLDIWAAGVTFFQIFTGLLPFNGKKLDELKKSILETEPTYPNNMTPEFKAMLQKCLKKDPKLRATVHDLIIDEWVTDNGKNPLEFKEYEGDINDIDEQEINNAITKSYLNKKVHITAKLKSNLNKTRENLEKKRSFMMEEEASSNTLNVNKL